MVHFNQVSKQYGSQVLFKNGTFQIRPGDKIGLVGPNGAGKTTVFRLIIGEEHPDEGGVTFSDKTVIGYFSQTVGEMSGRSALEEVKAGAGKVSDLAATLADLEAQFG